MSEVQTCLSCRLKTGEAWDKELNFKVFTITGEGLGLGCFSRRNPEATEDVFPSIFHKHLC